MSPGSIQARTLGLPGLEGEAWANLPKVSGSGKAWCKGKLRLGVELEGRRHVGVLTSVKILF